MVSVLKYCIVAFVCDQVSAMGKVQRMYFISMKGDDQTSQCIVDVRMMHLLRIFFVICLFFILCALFSACNYMWYVLFSLVTFG